MCKSSVLVLSFLIWTEFSLVLMFFKSCFDLFAEKQIAYTVYFLFKLNATYRVETVVKY